MTYISVACSIPASGRLLGFVVNQFMDTGSGQNVANDDQCVQILLQFEKLTTMEHYHQQRIPLHDNNKV